MLSKPCDAGFLFLSRTTYRRISRFLHDLQDAARLVKASSCQLFVFVLSVLIGATSEQVVASNQNNNHTLFVIANAQFTLCHEMTHVFISMLDIPIMSKEEDAADQRAAICILHPEERDRSDPQAVEKLIAVADAWRLEWALDKGSEATPYWDVHSLDIERYYDIVCLLYGSDPERFAHLPEQLGLPWERAWSCEEHEYSQAAKAGRWLLETYGIQDDQPPKPNVGRISVTYEAPSTEDKGLALEIIKGLWTF